MPAPTLPVAPLASDDPKKKKKEVDNGKDKAEHSDGAKVEEGEELVRD